MNVTTNLGGNFALNELDLLLAGMSTSRGLFLEMFLTAELVLTILMVYTPSRRPIKKIVGSREA